MDKETREALKGAVRFVQLEAELAALRAAADALADIVSVCVDWYDELPFEYPKEEMKQALNAYREVTK